MLIRVEFRLEAYLHSCPICNFKSEITSTFLSFTEFIFTVVNCISFSEDFRFLQKRKIRNLFQDALDKSANFIKILNFRFHIFFFSLNGKPKFLCFAFSSPGEYYRLY